MHFYLAAWPDVPNLLLFFNSVLLLNYYQQDPNYNASLRLRKT